MYATLAEMTNLRSGKNTLRKTMRNTLRQDWYPTLQVLRLQSKAEIWRGRDRTYIAELQVAWMALGASIALDESTEKRDYERELKRMSMVCAWKECKYHAEKPPTSLYNCKGCGEVVSDPPFYHTAIASNALPQRYCSRTCQKK